MIVVHTSTSYSPRAKASITCSSSPSAIWPWADDDARLGQQLAQLLGLRLDRLDPVVDEEDLAAAVELAQDRVAHEAGRRLRDARLDRQPVLRRRLDDAHVAHAGQRQVQRPRDGRRRQRQHVHLGAQLLEPLLVGDAEALLLVDDDQAQVPEARRPCDSSRCVPMTMSTEPAARPATISRCSAGRHEARQHPDA